MRPRELKTSSPLVEMYGAQNLGVSLGRAVEEVFKTPELGGRLASEVAIAGEQRTAFTDEQREQFRQAEAERRREISLLEDELLRGTLSEPEREGVSGRLADLYAQTETDRNALVQDSINAGRLMSEEQFREEFGDLLEYDGLITPEAARAMYNGRKEEVIRETIISMAPSGFVAEATLFGAGVANLATDPLELGSMFIPIVGPARKAQLVSRFGRVGGRTAEGAIEGAVGSLITEPFYYGLSRSQQLDYAMEDALFNVGAGLLLGGGIGTVVGALSRKGVNPQKVAEMAGVETRTITDSEGNQIITGSGVEVFDQAFALADSTAIRRRSRKMALDLEAKRVAEAAIRQMANDMSVQVDLVTPRAMPRPQTLSEFVRGRGGINDSDPTFRGELRSLGIEGRAQYLNSKGKQVNGISNPKSPLNMDDMAALAEEAGFISSRDTNELIEALRSERSGEFVFSSRDATAAQDWRDYHGARSDFDAEVERRKEIREEIDRLGMKKVSDEEVALMSEYMARNGENLDAAAKRLSVDLEQRRAQLTAERANAPESVRLADYDFARAINEQLDEADLLSDVDELRQTVEQIRADVEGSGQQLSEYARTILDEIEVIDQKTDSYIETLRAGITCIVRN
jgi:hypothetical protein